MFVFDSSSFSSKASVIVARSIRHYHISSVRSSASLIFFRFKSVSPIASKSYLKFPVRTVPSLPSGLMVRANIGIMLFILLFATMVIYALHTIRGIGSNNRAIQLLRFSLAELSSFFFKSSFFICLFNSPSSFENV